MNLTSVESFQTRTGSYKTESNQSKAFKNAKVLVSVRNELNWFMWMLWVNKLYWLWWCPYWCCSDAKKSTLRVLTGMRRQLFYFIIKLSFYPPLPVGVCMVFECVQVNHALCFRGGSFIFPLFSSHTWDDSAALYLRWRIWLLIVELQTVSGIVSYEFLRLSDLAFVFLFLPVHETYFMSSALSPNRTRQEDLSFKLEHSGIILWLL